MASTRARRQRDSGWNPQPAGTRLHNRTLAVLAERELSRTQLSEMTEIPYGIIRRLMRPGVNPPLEYALRISRALGVRVEDLFALEIDQPPTDRLGRGLRCPGERGES